MEHVALPARLQFYGNRWPYATAAKVPGSWRIAVVGDSFAFGQGVRHEATLSQRIAYHLNGLRPATWFEGLTFGLPGGCLFHALARTAIQVRQTSPDLVIVTLCVNDALMLRPEPATAAATGQTWLDFEPIIDSGLGRFLETWRREPDAPPVMLAYLAAASQYGDVRPQDVIRRAAARHGLRFVDAAERLSTLSRSQFAVSELDGHPNAHALDLAARLIVDDLQASDWLPPGPGFDDPAWLEPLADLHERLRVAGLPGPVAASQAAAALHGKWSHRRNRARAGHARYDALRQELAAVQRRGWPRLALSALARCVRHEGTLLDELAQMESWLYTLSTLYFALQHVAATGALGQPLAGLPVDAGTRFDAAAAPPTLARLQAGAAARVTRARRLFDAAGALNPDRAEAALDDLSELAARLHALDQAFLCHLRDLGALLTELPPSLADDAAAVAGTLVARATLIDDTLARIDGRIGWSAVEAKLDGLAFERPVVRAEIAIEADAGPERWTYNIGFDGGVPAARETYLACGVLLRDGRAHTYEVDLPLTLAPTFYFTVIGEGLRHEGPGEGPLRVGSLRLTLPGQGPVAVAATARGQWLSPTYLRLSYGPINVLGLAA